MKQVFFCIFCLTIFSCNNKKPADSTLSLINAANTALYEEQLQLFSELRYQMDSALYNDLMQIISGYDALKKNSFRNEDTLAFLERLRYFNTKLPCKINDADICIDTSSVRESAARLTYLFAERIQQQITFADFCVDNATATFSIANDSADSLTLFVGLKGYSSPLFRYLKTDSCFRNGTRVRSFTLLPDSNIYKITFYNLEPGNYSFTGAIFPTLNKRIQFGHSFRKQ